jgi:glycosyltransferase
MSNTTLVSIITPVINGSQTIEYSIRSILGQTYKNIERIIVDGGSHENTLDIVNNYNDNLTQVALEPKKGIYVAINRGLELASGEIIGILNSDDLYIDEYVIETVVERMNEGADACWGDLYYVEQKNPDKIIRYWRSSGLEIEKLRTGWMPPHPTFFVKKWVYDKYGYFNIDFRISADYEIMLRFLYKYRVSGAYIPKVLIKMRCGGISNKNIFHVFRKSAEDYKICRIYNLSFFALFNKNISKIPQFLQRSKE